MVAPGGGMHGCSWGACMVAPEGVCGDCSGGGQGVRGCSRGHAWLLLGVGGMCSCYRGHAWLLWGVCVVAWGHVWLLPGGACMVAPGGACMVAPRGPCMVAPREACVVAPGGCAWLLPGGMHGCSGGSVCGCSGGHVWDTMTHRDTVNERAVRILLECILVLLLFLF